MIHHFLKIEIFNGDVDVGDMVEQLYPQYLYREQYCKCIKVLEELYQWTEDSFYHQMSAFHELALYKFIEYMSNIQEDNLMANEILFDEKSHCFIEEASKKDLELSDGTTLDECKEFYYNIGNYPDSLFEDTNFLMLQAIYKDQKFEKGLLVKQLGINIDYYFDLLPMDIQALYKTKHITLTEEVASLLRYIQHRIHHGNLYQLFWCNDEPVNEKRIQLILENIMDAYFFNQKVEITREALVGNGKVDFKLYKNSDEEEKVLIEIKRASSSYLKKGYEKQLTDYLYSSEYKNAFYVIACFTDEEYDKSVSFIRNHVYTDTIQLYINISILDFRKRKPASIS